MHANGTKVTNLAIPHQYQQGSSIQYRPGDHSTLKQKKRELIESFERRFVIDALDNCGGNISAAARVSGKNRRAFWELMRKYDIPANGARGR
jgi:DNA-binding NtrC family response regulator